MGTHAQHPGVTPYAAEWATAPPAGRAAGRAQRLPHHEEFPAALPVPHSAVVTSVEHRTGGRLVVATPQAFLHKRVPEAAYTPEEGEVGEDAAKSDFSSVSVRGRSTLWKASDGGGGVYLTRLTSGRRISDNPSHRSP
ncbi:hypothetical protein [Streptomyces griseoluteus]